MKFTSTAAVLLGAVASVLGQTIDIGYPTDGEVLYPGETFTAQILRPDSISGCTEVGIALAIVDCDNGICPEPTERLGSVLYAGPFTPTAQYPGGRYQNFTLQVPDSNPNHAIFTLTHLCLLGAGPVPLLEYRNATITIEPE